MDIGIDSFAALLPDLETKKPVGGAERMALLLGEIETADRVGLDVFGICEHHREEYLDSAPAVILAAAAARTKQIRLTSAVTVLSAADPVRVFQQFATLDLISKGRAEIVVGRGSSTEAFPLFGWSMSDYDALFEEKLDLLLQLRAETHVTWKGRFRPALTGQGVFPRPHQPQLPIWLGRERGWPPPSRAQFDAACSPKDASLIGDPDTVVERVVAMNEALGGVSRVTFQMTSAMLEPAAMQRSIELLGTAVAPRVRDLNDRS